MARHRSIAVVVLGDVGRSPRMQYHTASLAALPDTDVSLVGYAGERCVDAVERSSRVRQYLLGTPFARLPRALFPLWAPLKALYQVLQLLWTLLVAIPALLAVWLACRLRGARMIIDWHNFGFSMLAHGLGPRHPLVRVATVYERALARLADGHLCVTKAMAAWLREQWGVS
jgi:beta-1,4-mannosyltransferase